MDFPSSPGGRRVGGAASRSDRRRATMTNGRSKICILWSFSSSTRLVYGPVHAVAGCLALPSAVQAAVIICRRAVGLRDRCRHGCRLLAIDHRRRVPPPRRLQRRYVLQLRRGSLLEPRTMGSGHFARTYFPGRDSYPFPSLFTWRRTFPLRPSPSADTQYKAIYR